MTELEYGEMWYVVEWARMMADFDLEDAVARTIEHVNGDRWRLVAARRTLRSAKDPTEFDAAAIELLDEAIAEIDSG